MFRKLRVWLRAYFGFSYREINGFLVLAALMVLLIVLPLLTEAFLPVRQAGFSQEKQQLDSLVARLDQTDTVSSTDGLLRYEELETTTVQLFVFDPNQISVAQWQQLGLKKFLAERIIKYRSKGGKFRKKEDLKKIYSFPSALYTRLEPYIQIPQTTPRQQYAHKSNDFKKPAFEKKQPVRLSVFDLNTADTAQLKLIYGIGTGFANRIIKYRTALGGFYAASQVREVYGLPSETADELLRYAAIQSPALKIKINSATAEELNRHPYLRGKGRVIAAYRSQHGSFQSPADLLNIKIIDSETVDKVKPYLEF